MFDYAKASGSHFNSSFLPDELFIDQLDDEQIWQQLEMQNDSVWEKFMSETCKLLSLNESKFHNITITMKNEQQKNENANISNGKNFPQFHSEAASILPSTNLSYSDHKPSDENDDSEVSCRREHEENLKQDLTSGDEEVEVEDVERVQNNSIKISNGGESSSIVDDSFFNMSEMEAFLDSEDKKELDRLKGGNAKQDYEHESDEVDYFDSQSDSESVEEDAKGLMFADFFEMDDDTPEADAKQRRKSEREAKNKRKEKEMKEDLGIEDSESENSGSEGLFNEGKSSDESENDCVEKSEFDMRQQRLEQRIQDLEEKALADKPWQLKGEIAALTRPKNSLLEEVLEFDAVGRPPPLITEDTTLCLEDIIKRRIKSKAWDDVERKIKPINDQQDFRKNLVLQQEKSKESLAQIYEKEYLEKVHKLNNMDDTTKPDEPVEYTGIRKDMRDLFIKLDALSNFHFTSKPVTAEAKIITNIPAIEMEEVAPAAVSDATLLAPEEVRARPVGDEIGTAERTATDKKRERRKKKMKQKLIKNQNDKRIEEKEKLGIKVTSKEKQQQLMNQVTKSRNVIKVNIGIGSEQFDV